VDAGDRLVRDVPDLRAYAALFVDYRRDIRRRRGAYVRCDDAAACCGERRRAGVIVAVKSSVELERPATDVMRRGHRSGGFVTAGGGA